ncbi:hypothetical protein QTJ16_006106 [Diplocarpon rosae]|uniref:Uncharacterized protein n=1 Tax=Diplocarpon rosae TaxID=946125 RepID=A0AAD9SUU1_9HELO|nr:hypothetical protein QTJ16_006106 [Diplocarpon rosae]
MHSVHAQIAMATLAFSSLGASSPVIAIPSLLAAIPTSIAAISAPAVAIPSLLAAIPTSIAAISAPVAAIPTSIAAISAPVVAISAPVAAIPTSIAAISAPTVGVPTLPTLPSVNTVQVVKQYVDLTNTAVRGDMDQLLTAINGSVSAQEQLIETIKADLSDVASQFTTAGAAIANSTAGVAGTLTEPEVFALVSSLSTAQSLAASLLVQYNTAKARLTQSTLAATQAEFQAALGAIKPFSDPLIVYAENVAQNSGAAAGAAANALSVAATALQQTVNILLGSLGIQV